MIPFLLRVALSVRSQENPKKPSHMSPQKRDSHVERELQKCLVFKIKAYRETTDMSWESY